MSKVTRLGEAAEHLWQWVTDGSPCEQHALTGAYRSLTLEVKGDLGGSTVEFKGGITAGDLAHLTQTRISPWIQHIQPVLFLQPAAEKSGITITVRGIL